MKKVSVHAVWCSTCDHVFGIWNEEEETAHDAEKLRTSHGRIETCAR
jgi:hypothetical protein